MWLAMGITLAIVTTIGELMMTLSQPMRWLLIRIMKWPPLGWMVSFGLSWLINFLIGGGGLVAMMGATVSAAITGIIYFTLSKLPKYKILLAR